MYKKHNSSEKIYSTESWKIWDQITPSNSQMAHGTTTKFWKERVHSKEFCKSANLKNAIRVRQNFEERTLQESLQQERCALREKHGACRKMSTSSKRKYALLSKRSMGDASTLFEKVRGAKFVVDSGASMRMLSKKVSAQANWIPFEHPGIPPR